MTTVFKNIPNHVAIIMDGNGRWAQNEGKERLYGHRSGVNSVREVVKAAAEIGVKYLTIYAFSAENWGRPVEEVDGLMRLMSQTLLHEIAPLQESGVKLHFIGDLDGLPQELQENIEKAKQTQVEELRLNLVVAINYSARWEMTQAVKQIISNQIPQQKITEQTISDNLQSSFLPDPELLIRTSGEYRLSNFMLWQLSYSELYFTSVLWPEFGREHFLEAIQHYNLRDRRFGLTK